MGHNLQQTWNEMHHNDKQRLKIFVIMLACISCFCCWVLFFSFVFYEQASAAVATLVLGCTPTMVFIVYNICVSVVSDLAEGENAGLLNSNTLPI